MAQIDHVVVLMLENRSFDSMLGRLYPDRPNFRGLTGDEVNHIGNTPYPVWTRSPGEPAGLGIPGVDPHEMFADMTCQIFGTDQAPLPAPNMGGFAANYASIPKATVNDIMHGFTPEQLPVLSTLGRAFAVSDCWHASAPNQTWPNRFFVHTGTANGYVNNSPIHVPYEMETIFNRLSQAQRSWRVYHHDMPQVATLSRIWSELPDHLYRFEEDFMADAMKGRLPNYSFIEPRYFSSLLESRMPNDQHPPHDVSYGERLIARCYDALRNGAAWDRTLFIILYDEHGGLYDHVPPPAATPPGGPYSDGFMFDRYGVRVPAVIVSPYVVAGSIARPPEGAANPFDHTTVLATLRKLFSLGEPLSNRDAVAPDLLHLLTEKPDNMGPASLALPTVSPTPAQILASHNAKPNGMQQALAEFAPCLPTGTAGIPGHNALLKAVPPTPPVVRTVGDALAHVEAGLARFLHGNGAVGRVDGPVAGAKTITPKP